MKAETLSINGFTNNVKYDLNVPMMNLSQRSRSKRSGGGQSQNMSNKSIGEYERIPNQPKGSTRALLIPAKKISISKRVISKRKD